MVVSKGKAFAVSRYDASWILDATFGTDGLVTTDLIPGLRDEAKAVALQADGKIVAVGIAGLGDNVNGDFALGSV